MPRPPLDRRSFLLAAGAAPLAAPLAARALRSPDDPEDMAAFGRLVGLKFSDKETEQADDQLDSYRRDYAALRRGTISFEMSPSTAFDPFPPGVTASAPTVSPW